MLYLEDDRGDENWHVLVVEVTREDCRDLTPFPRRQTRREGLSPRHPDAIVVACNDRDPRHHDLYRVPLDGSPRSLLYPRVPQAESDQIVKAMQSRGIPVTYLLYPDEGHGFARPENRMSFNAVTRAFLARCLGGACEPIGDAREPSSLIALAGAEAIAGLPEALARRGGASQGADASALRRPPS